MLAEVAMALIVFVPTDTTTKTDTRRDPMIATPSSGRVAVDGTLDESAWGSAVPVGDFVQRVPDWGVPGSEDTEVRVLYDADAIYIGIRAYSRNPDDIVAPLTRRDDTGGGDRVTVFIDSWHDRRTGFGFTLSAAGVRSDSYLYDENQFDSSWDGTWEGATTRDSEGWTAEYRIPFSQLRFSGGGGLLTFGFNVARTVASRNEIQMWQVTPQDMSQFVSRFGELQGLTGVSGGRRMEILPYVTGSQSRDGNLINNPLRSSGASAANVGLDLRMGLGSALTLTAAINPDFGQIDGDPATVNLSANEQFFEERRPFFTEASDAFRMPLSSGGGQEGLVYSRRIGRSPQLSADNRGGFADSPVETTILGAAKLTGKTRSGWTVAALAARTAEERAGIVSADGQQFSDVVEPGSLYGAARLGKDLRQGRTVVSGLATVVRRDLSPVSAAFLRDGAVVVGADLLHRWGADDAYRLRSTVTTSRVTGSESAIAATQRSSLRYYQRPDNDAAEFDDSRTSLRGTAAVVEVGRLTGDWRWTVFGVYRTPGFESNDLGFLRSADTRQGLVSLSRRWSSLGALSNSRVFLSYSHNATTSGERKNHGFNFQASSTLGNGWELSSRTWLRFGGVDIQALRGGPAMTEAGNWYTNLSLETDRSKRVSAETTIGRWNWFDGTNHGLNVEQSFTWRPAAKAVLGLGLEYNQQSSAPQLLGTAQIGGNTEYLVSDVKQRTVSATIRAGLTFSPTLSLQLWAEPFTSSAEFLDVRRVTNSRAIPVADRYGAVDVSRANGTLAVDVDQDGATDFLRAEPDFTRMSLRSNMVLRWEYRPSSTLFLVWQHDRSDNLLGGRFSPGQAFGDIFSLRARNQIAVKFTYWWNVG